MKKIKLLVLSLTIAAVLSIVMPAMAALADQANPDTAPTAEIYIYRNLLETGDELIVILANIPYASIPTATVSDAFTWRLIGTDNTTELASTVGYSYNDSGYGYNVYSMYMAAADNHTWGAAYTLRLAGNPVIFTTPPIYNFVISSSAYSSLTAQADEQAELSARILTLAQTLNVRWGLASDYYLTDQSESGTFLSLYGQAFFRGAIYGLQGMAPGAFQLAELTINSTDRTWSTAYSTNVTTQWTGTWVEQAQQGGAELVGASYDVTTLMLMFGLAVGIFLLGLGISKYSWTGLIDAFFFLGMMSKLGFVDPGLLALCAGLGWLYLSAKTWGVVT